MSKSKEQVLCEALMNAETQEEVIGILRKAGYWDDNSAWRLYGDVENNNGQVHGQQDNPDGALVEKLTNSMDALLIAECWERGIDPTGADAPRSIQEAVSRFFAPPGLNDEGHRISLWGDAKVSQLARNITLAATGNKPPNSPCLVIADAGEGQTPARMPDTFLSLNRGNKISVHFVQGKFNMGGTGVLRFCGWHGLQLVLTRRKPGLPVGGDTRDGEWGFTIVRREDGERSTMYTYLAPVGATDRNGEVLSFSADTMPIFPDIVSGRPNAFARNSAHGSLIKLYEYDLQGVKSNIVFSEKGLRQRLELHLCATALPVRVYECRDYRGHGGSLDTNLLGTVNRLQNKVNLEQGFPISAPLVIDGEHFDVEVYAFLKGKAGSYKQTEGVVFTLNGQLHGEIRKDFFSRSSVNLGYLKDELLVVVELCKLSARAREGLVMASRDRLTKTKMLAKVEAELANLLKSNHALRELQQRRREEDLKERLADDKPMQDLLKDLLKRSPDLAKILGTGDRLTNPFDTREATKTEAFKGKDVPTYFRFKGKEYGHVLQRDAHQGQRCRIAFETDAANDFFSSATGKGTMAVIVQRGAQILPATHSANPDNGTVHLNLTIPDECQVGDELDVRVEVDCADFAEPFTNCARLKVLEHREPSNGPGGTKPPVKPQPKGEETTPSGIPLPNIVEVKQDRWGEYEPHMTKESAVVIKMAPESTDTMAIYDYHVNMDNVHLLRDLKGNIADASLVGKQFQLALVLLCMCIVNARVKAVRNGSEDDEGDDIETSVRKVSDAIAPVLLPMIRGLANLSADEAPSD